MNLLRMIVRGQPHSESITTECTDIDRSKHSHFDGAAYANRGALVTVLKELGEIEQADTLANFPIVQFGITEIELSVLNTKKVIDRLGFYVSGEIVPNRT